MNPVINHSAPLINRRRFKAAESTTLPVFTILVVVRSRWGHGLSKTTRFNGSQPGLAGVFFIAFGQLGDFTGHIDDALPIIISAAKYRIALNCSTTIIRRPSVRDKPLFNWSILDTAVFTLAGFILLFALWTLGSWLFLRVLA
jgi:hypothetical protein